MSDCLFCRIAQKKQAAAVVYETDSVLAFRDVFPKAPIHVLVIPKEHIESVMQLETRHLALVGEIHVAIQAVARQEKIDKTGFRVVTNSGKESGQTVGHLHYHVLAGRSMTWPPG